MAYYVGLRVADQVKQLEPLKIRGLIPVQQFSGGVQRTGSELRLINDTALRDGHVMGVWSLPEGADRDHEYCNPMAGEGRERVEKIRRRGWRVLVTGTEGDALVDRGKQLVKMMEEKRVNVLGYFTKGGSHGIQDHDLQKAKELYAVVKNLISSSTAYE
ncbi:hypothetical protein QN277_000102 [Acacia crassicarpa]|uniref:Alpha/beta hydrolase fold-3 domain-containing protein n=1 Tax=Acacia crassicarpa TaxID=499986 RepID=A0AAE1N4E8_9FABA|nr:hypothetical protein QN277_000102 [Acacia crassicarpa]